MAIKCLECKCGRLFIDGGKDYVRIGGRNIDNYEHVEEESYENIK